MVALVGVRLLMPATCPSSADTTQLLPPSSLSLASTQRPRVAVAITTSRRPHLFRRALLSFKLRCLDCDTRVGRWFAVDDGSSPDQLAAMRVVLPGVEWIEKPATLRGHVTSLNAVLNVTQDYDYLVFLEDDFFFIQDEDYVAKTLRVFESDPTLAQVVFNRRYALTNLEAEHDRQAGGIEVKDEQTGTVSHYVHEYVGNVGSDPWKAFHERHPGKVSSAHWPHFSLNSGVWRLDAIRSVGAFEDRQGFEFHYGVRYMTAGFRTAFLPGQYSIHLGKPLQNMITDDQLNAMFAGQGLRHAINMTASAYDLNGVIRRMQ